MGISALSPANVAKTRYVRNHATGKQERIQKSLRQLAMMVFDFKLV